MTIIPIIYALSNNLIFQGVTTIGTYIFSITYWIHPIHGWRRNMDLLYAKYSFVVYFGSGIYYIPKGSPTMIFYVGSFAMVLSYYMTYIYPKIWIRYHILFHLLGVTMKIYILSHILQKQLQQQ